VNWIELAQDPVQWQVLVLALLNLQVLLPKLIDNVLASDAMKWLAPFLHIQVVPGTNLGLETTYHDKFSPFPTGIFQDRTLN
jgi:hypothetical protein